MTHQTFSTVAKLNTYDCCWCRRRRSSYRVERR